MAFVGILFAVALVALVIQARARLFGRQRLDGTIVVTAPEGADGAPIDQRGLVDLLQRIVPKGTLESLARQDGALVVSYVFHEMPPEAIGTLDADVRALAPGSTFSIFFARPGAL